jgi:hypothetical protein
LSEDEILAERLENLRIEVREMREEWNTYKRNVLRAALATAGYLGWVALHSVPAFEVLFK